MTTVGAVKTVLVCEPSAAPAAPCPAGSAPVFAQAYLIEPGSASYIDAVTTPFDYTQAAAYWSSAFVFTLTLYVVARSWGFLARMFR